MKKIVEKLIAKLKNDPSYQLDNNYTSRQLFYIVLYRMFQIFRGFFFKISATTSGIVFCGKGVIIQHGYQFLAGKSLILEEGVHINALSKQGIIFGDNVTIGKYAILLCTGVISNKGTGITIGDKCAIGAQSFLGGQGGIKIGNDVIIGPGVKIFSENHNYQHPEILIYKQGETRRGVVIEDNCWIGAGTTILDGVSISKGCVIAAGSVVTRTLPENSIAAGVPARVIKRRVQD